MLTAALPTFLPARGLLEGSPPAKSRGCSLFPAVLEPMMNDVEPSVREETARTIRTVRQHLHWLQRPQDPWYMLAVHCCLPRRLWQALKPKPEPEPEPQKNPEETLGSEDSSLHSAPCQSTDN